MLTVEAVATVYYTCTLSNEQEKMIVDYIKNNPEEFDFMSDEDKITKAVGILYTKPGVDFCIYDDSVESDFETEEIRWSEFEEKSASEILA